MRIDKPIHIQKLNKNDEYETIWVVHAKINKSSSSKNYADSGSERSGSKLNFEIRYFKDLSKISMNFQLYRIVYNDNFYYITDYDDYMEKHLTVKLVGVASG